MAFRIDGFEGSGSFARGVHPPEYKQFSSEAAIDILPVPDKVVMPLLQNIGAPCETIVSPKQTVSIGECIGMNKAFVSAPLHSPITGTVLKGQNVTLPNGRHVRAIPIKRAGEQTEGTQLFDRVLGGNWPKDAAESFTPQQISEAIQNAGIVGLGGAAFPTHVKIMPNDKKKIEVLLVNGCECEPFLTTDYRLMIEAADAIVAGALLAAAAIGAPKIVVGIEDNKPMAISAMETAAAGTPVIVATLKTKYPQGSEKHLIMAIMKRKVPPGGLPIDVGAAVSNVGTMVAVAGAVLRGIPLTHRVICVTGRGIAQPKNVLTPIGVSYKALISFCGGMTEDAVRIVSGGPMMGFAFADLDAPVTKGTSGVTIFTADDIQKEAETACVRCGRCVDVCPLNLVPSRLGLASRTGDLGLAEKYHIMACIECGCCAYSCPARLPLVQLIRMGKAHTVAFKKR